VVSLLGFGDFLGVTFATFTDSSQVRRFQTPVDKQYHHCAGNWSFMLLAISSSGLACQDAALEPLK
jgi:hypothetical protein